MTNAPSRLVYVRFNLLNLFFIPKAPASERALGCYDALAGLFLMAMWLMARRKIEHWLLWIVADAISVPLYFYKGLTFTALQYVVFTLIAIWCRNHAVSRFGTRTILQLETRCWLYHAQ